MHRNTKHKFLPNNSSLRSLLVAIENRIYTRGEFRESLGMIFFSPFQPEREFKVYKSCKCSQIIYSMFPRLFISISNFVKLLNKLELGEQKNII